MSTRIREWLGLVVVTGAAQITVQAVGFIGGILVIRLLPVHEYALYTLANTMLGTMTVLADGGIAAGVMSQGGKVWQDRRKLGAVLATGMELRRKFAVFSLLVAVPVLFLLLRKHDASGLVATLIILSLIPAFFSALSGTLLQIPLKLHQDIKPLQRYQVEANLGRLALLGLTMFVFPYAAVAVLCAGASQMWNNWRIRPPSKRHVAAEASSDMEVRENILSIVRSLLPSSIYYCISGQLALWILAIYGSTDSIAQVGALSRFAAALSVLQALAATLLVPRFSRLRGSFRSNLGRFVGIQAGLIFVGVAIIAACALIPEPLLKILGDEYAGLGTGLLLAVAAGCARFISTITHQLLSSRGLVVPAKLFIPAVFLVQCLFVYVLQPTEVISVLMLGLFTTVSTYLIRIGFVAWRLRTE